MTTRTRPTPPPEQLSLSGTLLETTQLREKLARAQACLIDLAAECATLRRQVTDTTRKNAMLETLCDELKRLLVEGPKRGTHAPVDQAWLLREMTRLLTICHPDKWHGSPVAEELTKHVIEVRQRLQEGP